MKWFELFKIQITSLLKSWKTKSDHSLQKMLLLASKRNQPDRTEDLMATPKSRIENAPPFDEWPCYSGTFRSLLSSLIYSPQIKLLLFSPCLNWYSVKGEHCQLGEKKNLDLNRVAVWRLRNIILTFSILEAHKPKGWRRYAWPCCPKLCHSWCVGLQPGQRWPWISILQQPRVGAVPPKSRTFVRLTRAKQTQQ